MTSKIDETIIRIDPVDLGLTMFGITPAGGAMAGSCSSDTGIEVIFSRLNRCDLKELFKGYKVEPQYLATFEESGC